jgi:hypothetical protein
LIEYYTQSGISDTSAFKKRVLINLFTLRSRFISSSFIPQLEVKEREYSLNIKQIVPKVTHVVIMTFLILLISFFMGEVAFRIYNYFNPLFIFYSDSYNRFRGKPFADDWNFKLNSKGFKDYEFGEKKEVVYRVLGIGDSVAYGVVPYKYNYLTLLESQLQHENVNVEVFNMGIPSIGPKEYLSLFVREGLALHPDMVLLSFFLGNDFTESDRTIEKRKLYSYSYVASLFHYIITIQSKYEGRIIHPKAEYCDNCPFFDHATYLQLEQRRSIIYLKDTEYFIQLLNKALYYLSRIHEICSKNGIEFVVVIIPDEVQINYDLQTEIRKTIYPIYQNKWNTTYPNDKLKEKFNSLGINYIDLYKYFADALKHDQYYRLRDTHWNIAGNQLAANIIQNHIRKYIQNIEKYRL